MRGRKPKKTRRVQPEEFAPTVSSASAEVMARQLSAALTDAGLGWFDAEPDWDLLEDSALWDENSLEWILREGSDSDVAAILSMVTERFKLLDLHKEHNPRPATIRILGHGPLPRDFMTEREEMIGTMFTMAGLIVNNRFTRDDIYL